MAKKEEQVNQEIQAPVEEKKEVKDIHELTYVSGKGWAVKRQGSTKVIKYFRTKLEAVQYILKISESRKTSVVIHLKNGKYQKFENATRALNYLKENNDND